MSKLISFIVPTYNDKNEIGECLESLKKLEKYEYEFIVIDDGSDDGTGEICDRIGETDDRFIIIHQMNQGVSMARNVGIELASGKWLCFVDGDDYIYPGNIENRIIPFINDKSEVILAEYDELIGKTLCIGKQRICRPLYFQNESIVNIRCAIMNRDYKGFKRIINENTNAASPWPKLYSAQMIKESGIRFVPGIIRAQDQLFNAMLFKTVKRVQFIPEKMYVYRGRGGRAYKYNSALLDNDRLLIGEYEKVYEVCEDKLVLKNYHTWIASHIINMLRLEFCNPTNPHDYRRRRKTFISYISASPFAEALNAVKHGDVGKSKQILFWLIRHKCFFILNTYYRNESLSGFILKIISKHKQ